MIRRRASKQRRWYSLLLLIPCIAFLWLPFYNKYDPPFLGIPFFYWYQILWIILTAVLTAIVYLIGV